MIRLLRQSLTAYAAPLCETIVDCPQPRGSEVLVRVRALRRLSFRHPHAGRLFQACRREETRRSRRPHASLHARARDRRRDRGRRSRRAGRKPGAEVAVYPWIGCGACGACGAGEENFCAAPRHLGIYADGGFATHVLVAHPRYLLDYAPLLPSFAGALMCSGVTAYAALKRLSPSVRSADRSAGRARRRRHDGTYDRARDVSSSRRSSPISMPSKREAALKAGAQAALDPADPGARKALREENRRRPGGGRFRRFRQVAQFRGRRAGARRQGGGHRPARRHLHHRRSPCSRSRPMAIEGILTGTLDEAQGGSGAGALRQGRAAADRRAAARRGPAGARRPAARPCDRAGCARQ